ncbi:HNH endonuclease signature motif containing protein [soil metagenome]
MANPTAVDLLAAVERASHEVGALVSLLGDGAALAASEVVPAVEGLGRLVDAARVLVTAPLARDRVEAERLGFASPVAAVATLAQVSERTARARLTLAEHVTPDVSVTGAPLPPQHPAVAEALTTGLIGVEAAVLVTRELQKSACRVPRDARDVVEGLMVGLACGLDPAGQTLPPASVDYLTAHIRTLGAAIDPDGARPREERAALRRDAWVGKQDDDGLFPFGGRLTPELAIPLQRSFEASRRSPRFVDASSASEAAVEVGGAHDGRTPGQRRHDTLGEILMAAIGADGAPLLNGRTASVLVTVAAADLHRADGRDSDPIGTMSGSEFPVSRRLVERYIDAGGYREVVIAAGGAVIGIGSPERCFTSTQTLAIASRDGERCFAPGCTTPHTALQVHHVVPWREGGPTNTGNGILLCYWHHQRVDDGPWRYRMANGLPEVRGPGLPEWVRPRSPLVAA